jgi:hypothetical protein
MRAWGSSASAIAGRSAPAPFPSTPDAQGRGTGRLLLLALFARLVDCGHRSALIWVVRANPSRYFYERLGGKLIAHRIIPLGGQPVEAVGYGWSDLPAALHRHARSGGATP